MFIIVAALHQSGCSMQAPLTSLSILPYEFLSPQVRTCLFKNFFGVLSLSPPVLAATLPRVTLPQWTRLQQLFIFSTVLLFLKYQMSTVKSHFVCHFYCNINICNSFWWYCGRVKHILCSAVSDAILSVFLNVSIKMDCGL